MRSDAASDASGVFTSDGRDIDLRRGTQLQLAIRQEGSQAQSVANGQ
jgi:hypothetical protein